MEIFLELEKVNIIYVFYKFRFYECYIFILCKEMYLRFNGVVEFRYEGRYLIKGICKIRYDDVTTFDIIC